jgi:hypothetical protein
VVGALVNLAGTFWLSSRAVKALRSKLASKIAGHD